MQINFEKMCGWERTKAGYLVRIALLHNLPMEGAVIDVNQNSGYTYYYHEDLNFCLYMPIDCDCVVQDVYVMYTSFEDGEEFSKSLADFAFNSDVIRSIEIWIESINK